MTESKLHFVEFKVQLSGMPKIENNTLVCLEK